MWQLCRINIWIFSQCDIIIVWQMWSLFISLSVHRNLSSTWICSITTKIWKCGWKYIMTTEMISSEESGNEDADIIVVKLLPRRWRRVTKFFYGIDDNVQASKSSQAQRQRKTHTLSDSPSSQPQPLSAGLPKWALELAWGMNDDYVTLTLH